LGLRYNAIFEEKHKEPNRKKTDKNNIYRSDTQRKKGVDALRTKK